MPFAFLRNKEIPPKKERVHLFWYRDVFLVAQRWPQSLFWYRGLLLVWRFCILLFGIEIVSFLGSTRACFWHRHSVTWRSKRSRYRKADRKISTLGNGRGTAGKCTGPKLPYSELDFSIRGTKIVHFGPFWPEEAILVHLGPPTVHWPLPRYQNKDISIPTKRVNLQKNKGREDRVGPVKGATTCLFFSTYSMVSVRLAVPVKRFSAPSRGAPYPSTRFSSASSSRWGARRAADGPCDGLLPTKEERRHTVRFDMITKLPWPLLFGPKKARTPRKKTKMSLSAEPLKPLEKKGKTNQKGKPQNEESKENKKARIGGSG